MECAMAASSGPLGGCSCLELGKNKELMCRRRVDVWGSSFSDRSHLQYYGGFAYCGKKSKFQRRKMKCRSDGFLSDKKKITLLDGLSKDLSALWNSMTRSHTAPTVDDDTTLADQVRSRILSDALEVIMMQLAQVKAERKERKGQLKALKDRRDDSSSSSSSEATDCESDIDDVSRLRRHSRQQRKVTENDPRIDSCPSLRAPAILAENLPKGVDGDQPLHLEFAKTADRLEAREAVPAVRGRCNGEIQVCMEPKCKKMGSHQLLEAFEGSIRENSGFAVVAVGCKCMGKCRNAPNVTVQKPHYDDNDVGRSQLHLGVSVGDVDLIVSQHFGEQVQCRAPVPD